MIYLITGLPGTGKTTAATKLCETLAAKGSEPIHLDGDNMRKCWANIGYTTESRLENIHRIFLVSELFHKYGKDVVVSVVAPSKVSRKEFRDTFNENYTEVLLTEIHEKRPAHFYPIYEPSETEPEYTGDSEFKKLIETI
mgnify:CR=1 FL=1|tara:strand:+ start:2387 stop:2806 length:420 start_codon:yes stop_codon:yes gene_type:complete